MAMGQRRSIVPIAIDGRSIVWVWGVGDVYSVCLFQKDSEWQNRVANKGVTYLFDYFDYSLFQFVWIITSECSYHLPCKQSPTASGRGARGPG
jgi:hypothetical protein